jgi:D-sedoheptulose 7-phosphate isomerase
MKIMVNKFDPMEARQVIEAYMQEASEVVGAIKSISPLIAGAAELLVYSLSSDGTVYWFGNGGSAADAQHLAAELVGRFELNRRPFRSVALTTDSSILTALGNDFGFETVFERQVEALATSRDVVIGISTSGASSNVIRGLGAARKVGAKSILLTGSHDHIDESLADVAICVPSKRTCHIQEGHIAIGQVLCGIVEQSLA